MKRTLENSTRNYNPFGMLLVGRNWGEDYRFGFNGKENIDEVYGEDNAVDFGARIYDPRLGRWMSVDALTAKYSAWSPYVFAMNSPIVILDSDGNDNVIYLVVLPSATTSLSEADINEIVKQANLNFESLGVKTRVVLATRANGSDYQNFDPESSAIDATDGIAIIGHSQEVVDYIGTFNSKFAKDLELQNFSSPDQTKYPENSYDPLNRGYGYGGKKVIAIDANDLQPTVNDINADGNEYINETQLGALVINHGAGHTGGALHVDEREPGDAGYTISVIMKGGKGDALKNAIRKFGYAAVTSDRAGQTQSVGSGHSRRTTTLNSDFRAYIQRGYGNNDPDAKLLKR